MPSLLSSAIRKHVVRLLEHRKGSLRLGGIALGAAPAVQDLHIRLVELERAEIRTEQILFQVLRTDVEIECCKECIMVILALIGHWRFQRSTFPIDVVNAIIKFCVPQQKEFMLAQLALTERRARHELKMYIGDPLGFRPLRSFYVYNPMWEELDRSDPMYIAAHEASQQARSRLDQEQQDETTICSSIKGSLLSSRVELQKSRKKYLATWSLAFERGLPVNTSLGIGFNMEW